MHVAAKTTLTVIVITRFDNAINHKRVSRQSPLPYCTSPSHSVIVHHEYNSNVNANQLPFFRRNPNKKRPLTFDGVIRYFSSYFCVNAAFAHSIIVSQLISHDNGLSENYASTLFRRLIGKRFYFLSIRSCVDFILKLASFQNTAHNRLSTILLSSVFLISTILTRGVENHTNIRCV